MAIKIDGQLIADSDIELTTVKDDICTYFLYQETIFNESNEEIPNPETKDMFVIRKAAEYLAEIAYLQRFIVADDEARSNVIKVEVQQ